MPRIIHFDLDADNPARAKRFYESVFGWKAEKWEGPMEYWMVTTGKDGEPGINGGISKRDPRMPTTTLTIGVESLDEFVRKVEKAGGKIIAKKMAIPGVGWFAAFRDPEGNAIGLMQSDVSAR